jgi:hypothetical protein
MCRDFQIELASGSDPELTAALVNDQLLVESRLPMADSCRLLLESGADPRDFVHFRRGGRNVGEYRLQQPAPWGEIAAAQCPIKVKFAGTVRQSASRRVRLTEGPTSNDAAHHHYVAPTAGRP